MIETIDERIIRAVYKKRENWAHKGNFGKILVIGGSKIYTGSPALVGLSALRAGADTVKIIAPRRSADACAGFSPEIITIPYDKDYLDPEAISMIEKEVEWASVITIGNGIGTGEEQRTLVNSLVEKIRKPIIIDADGIKVLDKKLLNDKVVITPNTYEYNLLFAEKAGSDANQRMGMVLERAKEFNTNILLKGHIDVISNGKDVFINKTNSVYMTKAGTGDTLTGILAGLVGQGNNLFDAACGAAFINGYTGRSIGKLKREALSPLDIVNNIYTTIVKWR